MSGGERNHPSAAQAGPFSLAWSGTDKSVPFQNSIEIKTALKLSFPAGSGDP
jgi:hypothetical protein